MNYGKAVCPRKNVCSEKRLRLHSVCCVTDMFSQLQGGGMDRNCFCCSPGGSSAAHSRSVPASQTGSMDVDSALSELDDLQSVTSSLGAMSCSSDGVQASHPERKHRVRSLSESQVAAMPGPSRSHSESSFFQKRNGVSRPSRRFCLLGTKMLGGCSSLPRKLGGYHLVQKNTAYVSDIVTSSSPPCPLVETPVFPANWNSLDSGRGSYSESTSSDLPPSSMSAYRDSDVLEDRARNRRLARVRLDRSRRLRKPYLIPLRMCQSMQEESLTSLQDLLSEGNASHGSKSTTASPVKQESDQGLGSPSSGSSLVRSRSIDNLELAKLRLTDAIESRSEQTDPQAVDQVASGLENLQMV